VDDVLQGLDFINAMVVGKVDRPDHNEITSVAASMVDGKEVVGYVFLPPESRRELLSHALLRAQGADSSTVRAKVLALGIVLAHDHADGNGRSARVVREVVENGYDVNDEVCVERVNTAAANRTTGDDGRHTLAFAPTTDFTRSWVCDLVSRQGNKEAYLKVNSELVAGFSSKNLQSGVAYLDPDKIQAGMSGVRNQQLALELRRRIQQGDIGPLIAMDVIEATGAPHIDEGLRLLDDSTTDEIIKRDNDRKLSYSKDAIDVAAGLKKVPRYVSLLFPLTPSFITADNVVSY